MIISLKMKIPDIKKILEPRWAHKPGWAVRPSGWYRSKKWTQATIPKDPDILKKAGIRKGDKVLAIAGFYGDWATGLAEAGAKVDYSDVSRSIVDYVKKTKPKIFSSYMCSNYELVPKKPREYDWTFTFEACGSKQGLPIAYLRSLLNNKGGILAMLVRRGVYGGGKAKNYPRLIKKLSSIYKTNNYFKEVSVSTSEKGKYTGKLPHRFYKIKTNKNAREMAGMDLKMLDFLKCKRKIRLKEDAKKLDVTEKDLKSSILRLNRFSKIFGDKFIRDIEISLS